MIDVQWPAPMNRLQDLLWALRNGFTLVRMPLPDGAAPSASPKFVLRRGHIDAPNGILQPRFVAVAISQGFIEPCATLADGTVMYCLKARVRGA